VAPPLSKKYRALVKEKFDMLRDKLGLVENTFLAKSVVCGVMTEEGWPVPGPTR